MVWSDEWIGIPYKTMGRSKDGIDCLGLFIALQRLRFNREIFDPVATVSDANRSEIINRERPNWAKINMLHAKEGDAILFNSGNRPLHVGYCLSGRKMLHCEKEPGSVIEDWRSFKWLPRIEGIYRYAD